MQLNEISSRASGGSITYMSVTGSPDAYNLGGRYELVGDDITVKVNLRQTKEKETKYRFEVKGKKGRIKEIAENILQKAMEWKGRNK